MMSSFILFSAQMMMTFVINTRYVIQSIEKYVTTAATQYVGMTTMRNYTKKSFIVGSNFGINNSNLFLLCI